MIDDQNITIENINEIHRKTIKKLREVEKILHLVVTFFLLLSLISIYINNIKVLSNKDKNYYNNTVENMFIYGICCVTIFFINNIIVYILLRKNMNNQFMGFHGEITCSIIGIMCLVMSILICVYYNKINYSNYGHKYILLNMIIPVMLYFMQLLTWYRLNIDYKFIV